MIKKTLILTAILALTTSTVLASENVTPKVDLDKKCVKCKNFDRHMPPRHMHKEGPKMDFNKRLNLTDEQKAQIKKNREADRKKMEPLMKQIKEKEAAKREIFEKYEKTDAQLIKLNKEIKSLKDEKRKIMEENRKAFEAMLTTEQKAELEKIKAEHKEHIKKYGAKKMMKKPPYRPAR